jgi:DDE domain
LLTERGIELDHVTVDRWLQRCTPLLAEAARPCRLRVGDRWQVDATYVKVAGRWRYLYRAIDQSGQVIDVFVPPRRDGTAARRFFKRRGLVWVALYHESAIVPRRPTRQRILGPPIRVGFPTELLASAGGHLWAIPWVGGSLADPQLHTVLEIDARSGRIVRSYRTRGRPRDVLAAGNTAWVATTEPNELVSFSGSVTR